MKGEREIYPRDGGGWREESAHVTYVGRSGWARLDTVYYPVNLLISDNLIRFVYYSKQAVRFHHRNHHHCHHPCSQCLYSVSFKLLFWKIQI